MQRCSTVAVIIQVVFEKLIDVMSVTMSPACVGSLKSSGTQSGWIHAQGWMEEIQLVKWIGLLKQFLPQLQLKRFWESFCWKKAWKSSRPRRMRERERVDFDLANGILQIATGRDWSAIQTVGGEHVPKGGEPLLYSQSGGYKLILEIQVTRPNSNTHNHTRPSYLYF